MAYQLDPNEMVDFRKLLMVNTIQVDTMYQLLIQKGYFTDRVRCGHCPSPVIPKFQVLEDLSDHIHLLDKRNHSHLTGAFRAQ